MSEREAWIERQVELIGTALPKLEAAQMLRDAMAFADAHHPNMISDGFGQSWLKCDRPSGCGLQIVRPGSVQCDCTEPPADAHREAWGDMPTFEKELESLLNRYSKENGSNTPDFILAGYLTGCLAVFNSTLIKRSEWYSDRPLDPPPAPPASEKEEG